MAEQRTAFRHAREVAIAKLHDYLKREHRAERLGGSNGGARFGRFVAAWKLQVAVQGESFDLAVVVRSSFPFAPPEVHFMDRQCFLRFPHVDQFGKLCLTNAASTFSPRLVEESVGFLLSETSQLIARSLAGLDDSDFILEFRDYWRRLPTFQMERRFWSLLPTNGPTRLIRFYAAVGFTLFADSDEVLCSWLERYGGGKRPKGFNPRTTMLLWLDQALHPRNYPKTACDIQVLARQSCANSDEFLAAAIPVESGRLPLILGFKTSSGPVLAGVEIPEPTAAKSGDVTKRRNCRNDGFRARRVPDPVMVQRYFGATPVSLAEVVRADAEWCLYRGGSGFSTELFAKKVAIVGCGSLGAELAAMLAKAGVGSFVLVDDEVLDWGNVSRHFLGGIYVGQSKATALASELSRQLPWLETKALVSSAEALLDESPEILRCCDLIISTTGDWTSECMLNAACRTLTRFPATIFGWTEAYGIAGHALATFGSGGCLACGTSEFGVFESRVSEWAEHHQTMLQSTGCGDLFQPYSATDIAPTKAIIAELALDVLRGTVRDSALRTWIGDTSRLTSLGGRLRECWAKRADVGELNKRMLASSWPRNPNCPLCN